LCEDYCEVYPITITGSDAFLSVAETFGDGPTTLYRVNANATGAVRLLQSEQDSALFDVARRDATTWWVAGTGLDLARLALSNGTAAGTRALTARAGRTGKGSNPYGTHALGDGAFACADASGEGWGETSAWFATGPRLVTQVSEDCSLEWGGTDGSHLWWPTAGGISRSDGTAGGTGAVVPEGTFAQVFGVAPVGDRVGVLAHEYSGSYALLSFEPPSTQFTRLTELPGEPWFVVRTADTVYFIVDDALWRSDLTPSGTRLVDPRFFDLPVGGAAYNGLDIVETQNDILWFRADSTALPQPLVPGKAYGLFVQERWAYFWTLGGSPTRQRLNRVDLDQLALHGTAKPEIIATFDPSTAAYRGELEGGFALLPDGRITFAARDRAAGEEVFVTDGTPSGTERVTDVFPGPTGGVFSDPVAIRSGVVFAAHDGQHGVELWFSDGTPAGTKLVRDLAPGLASSSPDQLFTAGDVAYLSADDGKRGREMWVVEP
jgi:ELWxxDGT repeat protein